ncbi:MAG: hypothetical protein ACYC4L_10620 [Chloroflexota bacterium]
MQRLGNAVLAALALVLVLGLSAGQALAHDGKEFGGKYELTVGFLDEPAYAGQLNGAQIKVTVPGEQHRPVAGLESTLKAEVIVGGNAASMPLALKAMYGQPGTYVGYFVPTREGSYTFRFFGTIEGQAIDEHFESGPGRFNDVETLAPLQFPDRVVGSAQLAQELSIARAEAQTARVLGLAGLLVGGLGLVLSLLALRPRRASLVLDR